MTGFPIGTPVSQLVTTTANPATTQYSDGSIVSASSDHQGGTLIRQLGGKRYAGAVRGNTFSGGSVIAGVTLIGPIAGTTLASTAGLINPAGSGRLIELISVSISTQTVDVALKPFALGIQINPSANGIAPTAITKQPTLALPYGGPGGMTPVGFTYSAATLNFTTAIGEVFNVNLYPWGTQQTAVGSIPGTVYFDGEVLLGPDSNICCYNVVSALATVAVTWTWAEWLP